MTKPYDKDEAERLLEIAATKQTDFWNALNELEAELGIDIDSARDFQGMTVEDLFTEEDDETVTVECPHCGAEIERENPPATTVYPCPECGKEVSI